MKDYDPEWPRNLDFLPLLGLQYVLDDDLKLYHCRTEVSVQEGRLPPKDFKTEFGTIKIDTTTRTKITYEFGRPESKNGIVLSPKEILDDVSSDLPVAYVGRFPDVIIKRRGVVEKIPKSLEDEKPFQGSEDVFYLQTAYGNWTHKMRGMTGLPLSNPHNFIKADLLRHSIIKSPSDVIFRKLRSILKTNWMRTDATGYDELGRKNIFLLDKRLSGNKWWQDIGLPHPIESRIDHRLLQGNIYRLLKRRGELIIV